MRLFVIMIFVILATQALSSIDSHLAHISAGLDRLPVKVEISK